MSRLRSFGRSFGHAWRGLKYVIRHEKNFQNELAIAIAVILGALYFGLTRAEMVVIFLVIMGVMGMEMLNTIMERIVDMLKPKVHPYARLIKDIMAAAVLLASVFAIIIGIIIFFPYIAETV